MKRFLAAAFALFVSAPSGHAADKQGKFALDGGGGTPCKAFVESQRDEAPESMLFAGWIDGYATAFNQFNPDTYDLTGWQSNQLLRAMLKEYCAKHPDQLFGQAVATLAAALWAGRVTEMSELVRAENGKQGVLVYRAVLESAQRALAKRGDYKGPEDGSYGPATRDALKRFQTANKLQPTGLPDQHTLYVLFYRPPADAPEPKPGPKAEPTPKPKP